MAVITGNNNPSYACSSCGSDLAGYVCSGCQNLVCSCEECPACAEANDALEQAVWEQEEYDQRMYEEEMRREAGY